MNIAEWILVGFLSVALLVFIIVGIIALIKWNHLVDEAKKVVIKGQDIATTANDIAENVKGMTSLGKIVKTVSDNVVDNINKAGKTDKTKK
ncbi:hypothetical protein IJF86_02550 [Candidatus Saccharibacteria bacterium]|nr:hypothetical protein [Candidatus Saccharibacteria bacterium]